MSIVLFMLGIVVGICSMIIGNMFIEQYRYNQRFKK